jgi:methylenetetrahydrofolate reductase (NADPH)
MHIRDIFADKKTTMSYEFFPPKTQDGKIKLFNTINDLKNYNPSFVSVTYGAGGSTSDSTHNLVIDIQKKTDINVVSHLTCVGGSKQEIYDIMEDYYNSGITNIMALRGDPPQEEKEFTPHPDGFKNAAELIKFLKKNFPDIGIGAAAYPEGHRDAPDRLSEIDYIKRKVDVGADYLCCQFFFNNNAYYDFVERCKINGIDIPIIAGILPISSLEGLKRMVQLSPGTNVPAPLLRSIYRAKNKEEINKIGLHWTTQQVYDLLNNNVRGIHFYSLNKKNKIEQICNNLGITDFNNL